MRFRFLDGLRGLAALIVVFDHLAISFFPAAVDIDVPVRHGWLEPWIERTPLHVLVAGNFSVCIFFVLSGFVLSSRFFQTGERAGVWRMAAKRYFRLGLPILVSVMLGFSLIKLHAFHNVELAGQTGSGWLLRFWRDSVSFWQALYHGLIGIFISGQSDQFNTVLWTMQTEMLGSFLVFALLLAVGKWRYRYMVYALLLALMFRTYYTAFIAGLMIADLSSTKVLKSARSWLRAGGWKWLLLAGVILGSSPVDSLRGTVFQYLGPLMPHGLYVSRVTHIVGAIGLVLAVLAARPLQKWLEHPSMVWLGDVSFGLYLTHMYVIGTITAWLFVWPGPGLGYLPRFIISGSLSLAAMLILAEVFARFVDQPAISLSNRLIAGLQKLVGGQRFFKLYQKRRDVKRGI